MPSKVCAICGKIMEIDDWYAYIRTKYCKACAAGMTRENKRQWAKEFRRQQREKNIAMRELCKTQKDEIRALKALVQRQREAIQAYDKEMR